MKRNSERSEMSVTMSMHRIFKGTITAIIALTLMAFNVGCSSTSSSQASSAEDSSTNALAVASMKGATSIGIASMMQEDSEDDEFDFEVYASADEIAPKLVSGDLDIALIPANLAATLSNKTDGDIKVIDVNTLGVLYAITADENLKALPSATITDIAGYTIFMTGKGTVPEYTVRILLESAGLSMDSVNIEFCSEPSEAVARLESAPRAVAIVPQPYATAATLQNDQLASIIDLSEQWDILAADETSPMPDKGRMVTGVTVARASVIDENPEAVEKFIEQHRSSAEIAMKDPSSIAAKVVELGIVGKESIAEVAIPLCNIVCLTGEEMEDALSGYLEALFVMDPDAIGGDLPGDELYYLG